jgi:nitrogenase molybdenum-iron protein NifN
MGESVATLVIGRSLAKAADLLKQRTGVPDFRFDHLLGLDACDAFTMALAEISGQPVPPGSTGSAPSCRTRWSIPIS